jgi:hypothetical protein
MVGVYPQPAENGLRPMPDPFQMSMWGCLSM